MTVRRLWIAGGSLLTVLALPFFTVSIVVQLAREDVTETHAFAAAGIATVDIDNDNGHVEVLGGDVDEVTVSARIGHGLQRTRHEIEQVGDRIQVDVNCPFFSSWCGADLLVTVPHHIEVRVHTGDGRAIVRDIDGPVTVSTSNGAVEITRVDGDLDVRTQNGPVTATSLQAPRVRAITHNGRVTLAFDTPPTDVTATSKNGRVGITLPESSVAYRTDVSTGHGTTDIAVPTDPASDRVIVARTSNGDVTIRYPTG